MKRLSQGEASVLFVVNRNELAHLRRDSLGRAEKRGLVEQRNGRYHVMAEGREAFRRWAGVEL
jgi:hypothetical protein